MTSQGSSIIIGTHHYENVCSSTLVIKLLTVVASYVQTEFIIVKLKPTASLNTHVHLLTFITEVLCLVATVG